MFDGNAADNRDDDCVDGGGSDGDDCEDSSKNDDDEIDSENVDGDSGWSG